MIRKIKNLSTTKKLSTIITAVCAAIMFALYCTSFEFNNPVDPKVNPDSGNEQPTCISGENCDDDVGRCLVDIGCLNSHRRNCVGLGTFEFGESCQTEDNGWQPDDQFNTNVVYTTFTDSRNGKTYRTIVMPDGKTWMAENLNYETIGGSWCYDDDDSNCNRYGRLYNWSAATTVCPSDWRLPTRSDWIALITAVEPSCNTNVALSQCDLAGTKLKSQIGWESWMGVPEATDMFGFSALGGGYRRGDNGTFREINLDGSWWADQQVGQNNATYISLKYNHEEIRLFNIVRSYGFSVRCVRD